MASQNNAFRLSFINNVRKAVADASGVEGVTHQGLKGKFREIFVTRMLEPVLPPEVRVGAGQLVSRDGSSSGEIDALLYAPSIMPPALHDKKNGLFPVEAALYTLEVKSTLSAAEIKKAIKIARSVEKLPLMSTEHWHVGQTPVSLFRHETNTAKAIKVLFAFGSDLKPGGKTELERYREHDSQADTKPAIGVICVVGRGYWYMSDAGWKHQPSSAQFDEVMALLAGISNTMPQLLVAKGRPKFGSYLLDEHFLKA